MCGSAVELLATGHWVLQVCRGSSGVWVENESIESY